MTRLLFFRSFVICFALAGVFPSYAGTDLFTANLRGSEITSASQILIQDNWYDYMQSNNDWYDYSAGDINYSKRFANVQAIGRVSLQYDGSELQFYANPWELGLTFRVRAYDSSGDLLEDKIETLTINYDPNYNVSFVDKAVREYPDAHRLDIELTHLCGQPNGVTLLKDDFIFEAIIEVDRFFIIDYSTALNTTHHILEDNGNGENTVIEYLWSFTEGAEEYELQYVHVTDQLVNNQIPGDLLDFTNATRIITPFQDFRLIPAFETGSLYYRVRALGRHGEAFTARQMGKWAPIKEIVLGKTLNGNVDILAYEQNHNWIHEVEHAEFGKRKETSFFVDGSGETRQSVRKNNETELVTIQESMLDYEGRPAVNILPSPFLPDDMDLNNLDLGASLRFYNNYTLAHNTLNAFNKDHFDQDANRHNPLGIKANTAEGAGSYFSSANPLSDYSYHRYLPSAVKTGSGSFAYTRILYDDQGRLKETSGIGPDYKIGSDHTTKYYYGNPSQKKLDRLFGTEIGYAEHYRKKMVEDANGQLSVTYETLGGEPIATALVGYAPTQTINGSALPLVEELSTADGIIGMTTDDLSNHNQYVDSEQHWEINYTKLVSTPGDYNFSYDVNLTEAEFEFTCGTNQFEYPCEYLLEVWLLDPEGEIVNFAGDFNVAIKDDAGNIGTSINQSSFPVELVFGNNYALTFSAFFGDVGNYTIAKELRPKGIDEALAAYSNFVNDPENGCVNVLPIVSDCEEPVVLIDPTWTPANGEDCGSLLDLFKSDLSPGGQYFDHFQLGVSDPTTKNDWLKGVGYAGPNILDPNNNVVSSASFNGLLNILTAEGITISITTVDEGWNTARQYWNIPSVQQHFLGLGSGQWKLQYFHPEYGHYYWCQEIATQAVGNADFNLNDLKYANIPTSWIPDLKGTCPTGNNFYDILDADPYFSGTLGNELVNGNGLSGKALMRSLICEYPEQPTQGNSMWEAAEQAELNYLGTGSDEEIWNIFVNYYLQQKGKVINLQKKNPCDNDHYSPFLFDAASVTMPANMVADLPRDQAVYLWGPSAYNLGGDSSPPSPDLHPTYDNWEQSCAVLNNLIPKTQNLLSAWNFTDDNEQMRVTDIRAEGFQIRILDQEQVLQDLVDETANDGIFGQNDDWQELEDMMEGMDPCAQGASAMIPYGPTNFPKSGTTLAAGIAKRLYFEDALANPPACEALSSDPSACTNLIDNTMYYSYEDFYSANPDFFDCVAASVNNFTSTPWNFTAFHTPTHLVLNSPEHYADIPSGTPVTTSPTCNCAPFLNGNGEEIGRPANSRQQSSSLSLICYPFTKPCEQIIPHCLCEDFYAARDQTGSPLAANIAPFYTEEYGGNNADWTDFLNSLAYRCNVIIYNPNTTESSLETAISQIEDLADGVVDLPASPNTPAPVPLDCFNPDPDPCVEGQLIADYYTSEAYQNQIDELLTNFALNFPTTCMSPTLAPDELKMTYEDREYHFTLYYRTPAGNLYATVPPEGVRPISDADPALFDQIGTIRANGWTDEFIVPEHRRNAYRADQMMTVFEYNSLGNRVKTKNPDYEASGTELDDLPKYGTIEYFYDDLGRLRFSIHPQQALESKVAYVRYDEQNRIVESGQMYLPTSTALLIGQINNQDFPQAGTYPLENRVIAYHDETNGGSPGLQENLRQRVSKTEYYESGQTLSHVSHYSYDVRGNVKTIWQEDKKVVNPDGFVKRIDYEYGVVDGLLYGMDYQKGAADAYTHKYDYDANNRLIWTHTSDGGGIWDRDQRNFYRYDKLLARMELGAYKVQGIDYAFTLQGWTKGVNSSSLNASRDMGNDGALTSSDNINKLHRWTGRDAYGYSLYFHPTDYTSIENFSVADQFYTDLPSSNGLYYNAFDGGPVSALYNGNISAMQTALSGEYGAPMDYVVKGYFYDQLMRLKNAQTAMEPALPGANNQVYTGNYWDSDNESTDEYLVNLAYDRNGNITSLERKGYLAAGQNVSMDDLTYHYNDNPIGRVNNKLKYLGDAVNAGNYSIDIDAQIAGNYVYDRVGNLIADASEEIASIDWTVQSKVKKVTRTTNSQKPDLEYRYDSAGNRIEKINKPKSGIGQLLPQEYWTSTLYVRDPKGAVLATYEKDYSRPIVNGNGIVPDLTQYRDDVYAIRASSGLPPPTDPTGIPELEFTSGGVPPGGTGNEFMERITWKEIHLFASSRIGIERKEQLTDLTEFIGFVNSSTGELVNFSSIEAFNLHEIDATIERQLGDKNYELVNHLGNVLEVVSDKVIPVSSNGVGVDHFEADVQSAIDYYPFGMEMPGRKFISEDYRYGFNGKENDREWGNQLIQDYGFRLYNPAIGKFLSVDPLMDSYPWYTPYQFAGNKPIESIDLDGLEEIHFSITMQHEIFLPSEESPWKEYVPFANYPKVKIVDAVISDVEIVDQVELSFKVTLRLPVVPVHNPGATTYEEYIYEGTDLEGITDISNYKKKEEHSLGEAFKDGFKNGVSVALFDPLLDKVFGKALKFITPKLSATTILKRVLSKAGFKKGDNYPGLTKQFKRKFSEGGFDFEVRIHGPDLNAPVGSNSYKYMTARIQRRKKGVDKNGQGYGWEEGDGLGNWFSKKELKKFNKDGTLNPKFNEKAMNDVHIPIMNLKIE